MHVFLYAFLPVPSCALINHLLNASGFFFLFLGVFVLRAELVRAVERDCVGASSNYSFISAIL